MITYSELGRMGWLGNTLFQIATTTILANKVGTQPGFPRWMYQSGFKNKIPFTTTFPHDVFKEKGFGYEELPLKDNIDLWGHFQSYKYFDDCYLDVINLFKFEDSIVDKIEQNFKFLKEYDTCSIHVRRGDYIKFQEFHCVLPIEYYKEAIDRFDKNALYVVFSDDIAWCKENLKVLDRKFLYIDYNHQVIELSIMKECKNHIIANSSFSWWGAYLCQNPDKKIIIPNPWFGPANKHFDTTALCPPSWEEILWEK